MCSLVLLYFLTQYTGGELFSALRKLKKIVNLTVTLPVRKTSFLYSIDYGVTVGKAKGHRLFLFKQIKSQNTVYIFGKILAKIQEGKCFY